MTAMSATEYGPASRFILVNGHARVLAPTGGSSVAETVGVDGERIAFVGTLSDARSALPGADEIDIDGGTVLAGITDSHTHFKRASTFLAMYIDFDAVAPTSIEDVQRAVAERVTTEPPGKWIQGDGLDPTRLAEQRFPTRAELDHVAPSQPVVLRSVGRHVVAANSAALLSAGIDQTVPDPPGGRIERDDRGEPTGVLHEEAKLRLDANRADTVIPPENEKDRIGALSRAVELLHQHGIVAIHEMPRDPDQVSDWLALRESEPPRMRVRFYIRGLAAQTSYTDVLGAGLRTGFGDEWLKLGGIKLSLDGSGAFGNAMVFEPYPGRPGDFGLQRVETEDYVEAVRRCHDAGLQLAVHAIGARAVEMALGGFAALGVSGADLATRRHRIEHAYLPGAPGQLERIRELGLVLSTQPAAIEAVGDSWRRVFRDDEMTGVMPIASAESLGIPIQLNSDFPCAKLDPFVGVAAAVNRRTATGHILDRSQAIDAERALSYMTYQPAHTAFEESWRGRLGPGQAADVIVVNQDPVSVEAEELASTSVTMTVVGGRIVHRC